ncbi:radical SAM family heme chaperone HemW [Candidatus Stoquefichus massiliensis]|uniref:radical SAM family heme chaperone HemW n=1 Tax=Candidatus Stoquefichus massiliensis TaxID=1470350 RepID=UPI000489921F|nr:radical SAM family heme chaperone HemW [Candidatus Stoquefichus massiliensis]
MRYLYVHIPFCDHICFYCDFCKVFYKEDWSDQYLDALAYEIQDKHIEGSFDTIYIGGGTPSSLSIKQLTKLFEILKPFSKNTKEYSFEVNPESMNEEKLDLMVSYHINRISVGVQTFRNHLLKYIGRHHTSLQAYELIKLIHSKGIDDINVDLMYGLPNQVLDDINKDLYILEKLPISHVSIYSLILEEHTALEIQGYHPLNDEEDANWYREINYTLGKLSFTHYEVSNYYRTKPSLHNLAYWQYQDYQGIGLSAHSLLNHQRIENTNSLTQYLKHHYLKEIIPLSQKDELFEKIMMGLRLTEGISISEMNTLFDIDFLSKYQTPIQKYQELDMLEIVDNHLRVTTLGMNYLNTILVDFLD